MNVIDHEIKFFSQVLSLTIKKETFKAIRWTTISMMIRSAIQFLQLSILARLLQPSDFGLMAMVSVVSTLVSIVSDFGFNSAYIQRQNVTLQQRSSLFWMNVIISSSLSFLVILTSPLLARLFGDFRITPLLMLVSLTFIFSAFGQQIRINAEKSLNFKPVALIEISSITLGFIAAIGAAFAGNGVYSIVWGSIVSSGSGTLFYWIFIRNGWNPIWRFQVEEVKEFIGFGGAVLGMNIINYINISIDVFLAGRLLGATQLGIYSVLRTLILRVQFLINPIITRVGFPLIAQIQHDPKKVKSIYVKTLNMTASTNAMLYLYMVYFSKDIISIFLGDNWCGSADLFRVLAIWGFLRSTANPLGSLLLGTGNPNLALKWNAAQLAVVLPSLWWGAKYGSAGLAWSLLVVTVFFFLPAWLIIVRPLCNASIKEYSVATLSPAILSLMAIFPGYLLANYYELPLVRLGIGASIAFPTYIFMSHIFNPIWTNALIQLLFKKI